MNRRILEMFGLLMVGDGILSLFQPKRHCLLWEIGPKPCRELIDTFAQHPTATRWAGIAEAGLGLLLAAQQKPALGRRIFQT